MSRRTFGERVRVLRNKQHLTQRALADLVGVDNTYISRIERGRVDHLPSVSIVRNMAEALGVDELTLLQEADRLPVGLEVFAAGPEGREFLRRVTQLPPTADDWRRLTATLDARSSRAEPVT
jgi:transcriptional regulator with XRE-family HTH domain